MTPWPRVTCRRHRLSLQYNVISDVQVPIMRQIPSEAAAVDLSVAWGRRRPPLMAAKPVQTIATRSLARPWIAQVGRRGARANRTGAPREWRVSALDHRRCSSSRASRSACDPQLRFRMMPVRGWTPTNTEHYVVISGQAGDDLTINDPLIINDPNPEGCGRAPAQCRRARPRLPEQRFPVRRIRDRPAGLV